MARSTADVMRVLVARVAPASVVLRAISSPVTVVLVTKVMMGLVSSGIALTATTAVDKSRWNG